MAQLCRYHVHRPGQALLHTLRSEAFTRAILLALVVAVASYGSSSCLRVNAKNTPRTFTRIRKHARMGLTKSASSTRSESDNNDANLEVRFAAGAPFHRSFHSMAHPMAWTGCPSTARAQHNSKGFDQVADHVPAHAIQGQQDGIPYPEWCGAMDSRKVCR